MPRRCLAQLYQAPAGISADAHAELPPPELDDLPSGGGVDYLTGSDVHHNIFEGFHQGVRSIARARLYVPLETGMSTAAREEREAGLCPRPAGAARFSRDTRTCASPMRGRRCARMTPCWRSCPPRTTGPAPLGARAGHEPAMRCRACGAPRRARGPPPDRWDRRPAPGTHGPRVRGVGPQRRSRPPAGRGGGVAPVGQVAHGVPRPSTRHGEGAAAAGRHPPAGGRAGVAPDRGGATRGGTPCMHAPSSPPRGGRRCVSLPGGTATRGGLRRSGSRRRKPHGQPWR